MAIEPPLVTSTAAPPLRTRLVPLPTEFRAIVPLSVIVPARVVVVLFWPWTVLLDSMITLLKVLLLLVITPPTLMVRPLSVLLLLAAIVPPPEAVSVPPVTDAPLKLTSEPGPTAWMVAPVLVTGAETVRMPPLVASIRLVLVTVLVGATVRLRRPGWR